MRVPRQVTSLESGRANQKQRTRNAIVEAARGLLADGTTPTVATAAERALVSRTTAYRYFPTQESLLLEVAADADVDDIEAMVARPVGPDEVRARVRAVVGALNGHVLADETRYRALLRAYLDLWAAAAARGETDPVIREGRRVRWLDTVLEPAGATVPPEDLARLRAALTLVTGAEAVVALRDVAHLTPDEALAVTDWAATALLAATLGDA